MATKKTIALVANSTWNIYNFRQNLIDKFIAEGMEVVVIAPVDEYISYKENFPTVKHFNLRMLDRDGMNPITDFLLILELARRYKKIKPDIVLHFTNKPNIYGSFAAKIGGVKKSYSVITGLGYAFIHNGIAQSIMKILYKLASKFNQGYIFENIDDRFLFIKLGITEDKKSISIKGCGVNRSFFYPFPNGQIHEKTIFTFIGRLLYDKGIREFVEAARTMKGNHLKAEFWIIGELDEENPATVDKDELISWVENDIVIYHGFLKDVRPMIAKSDCIVLPSYREGLPRVNVEALAMGKPIITTNVPGCRETVEDGKNGFLIEPMDSKSLYTAMEKFQNLTHDDRKKLGLLGIQKAAQEFDDKIIANEIFEIVR